MLDKEQKWSLQCGHWQGYGKRSFYPFTSDFMVTVTVSDINGLFFRFFLYKIYSKTGI